MLSWLGEDRSRMRASKFLDEQNAIIIKQGDLACCARDDWGGRMIVLSSRSINRPEVPVHTIPHIPHPDRILPVGERKTSSNGKRSNSLDEIVGALRIAG